jgi:soluble lytic murein transglycosylase-like protein
MDPINRLATTTQGALQGVLGKVTGAIKQAAQATGASFDYLMATAKVESNLNPSAQASTSSAGGLFQFVDQTWLTTVKEQGPALGYGHYADAITRGADGTYTVPDPAMRNAIMTLRDDPGTNAVMAGAFTNHNAQIVAGAIGRKPTDGELYIAHFLGASGAGKLITLAAMQPNTPAANAFPGAAAANRPIFYDQQGQARSAGDVYGELVRRHQAASQAVSGLQVAASTTPPTVRLLPAANGVTATDTMAMAQAYTADPRAAQQGPRQIFHSLFSTDGSRTPVSPVVADLWGGSAGALTSNVVPTALTTSTPVAVSPPVAPPGRIIPGKRAIPVSPTASSGVRSRFGFRD